MHSFNFNAKSIIYKDILNLLSTSLIVKTGKLLKWGSVFGMSHYCLPNAQSATRNTYMHICILAYFIKEKEVWF